MDLNLYLGLPLSPRPRSLDLGSDLALSSLPLPSSPTTVEGSRAPISMSGALEPSDSHPPYSPSHAEYTPDLSAFLSSDRVASAEYIPYFPSYERYGQSISPISPVIHDPEAPDAPYSRPSVQPLPAGQEPGETAAEDVESDMLYDPSLPPRLADEPIAYSPPYVSGPTNPQDNEAAALSFYPSVTMQTSDEFQCPEDGPSSMPEPLQSLESCFRRLIESSRSRPNMRFRSSIPRAGERFRFGSPSLPNPEQSVHDLLSSQRPSECNEKHKVVAEDNATETSEEEREEKGQSAANFECNICFDMAAEPVVTSCGHLFCWPCLYQWLHVHSDDKECPVCKGEVTESNITPIYGRGNSQPSVEKKIVVDGESTLKIPPRPRGSRFESFRQQFRPVSRRLGEGIAASWRRLIDQHMRNGNRYEAYEDPSLQEILDNIRHRSLTRLRARRLQREVNPDSGSINGEAILPINNITSPMRNNTNSIFRDGFSFYGVHRDRLASTTTDLGRVVRQFASSSNGFGDVSTSSANPPNPAQLMGGSHVEAALAADRASASSTMAVIQGDVATPDTLAEPNNAGSSRPYRRRGRSSTSGSFDVDEGTLHASQMQNLKLSERHNFTVKLLQHRNLGMQQEAIKHSSQEDTMTQILRRRQTLL